MDSRQMLFALLRMQICGAEVKQDIQKALSRQMLEEVYSLAKKHDLAHIAGQALSDLGCLGDDEISLELKKQAMLAVYRHTRMEHDLKLACDTLEKAEIPYMPLKGAVIRKYYPEAWMRTSCDIDILVKQEFLESAQKRLEQQGFCYQAKTSHDISMRSPGNVHLELHFDLTEDAVYAVPAAQMAVLRDVWEWELPCPESKWVRQMPDEMFYFYHISHMAKHFENGGCGIKPFLDLWILHHRVEHEREKREALLEKGGLLIFAKAVEKLSRVWFSGEEADEQTRQLEQYILDGGVYGTSKNSMAVKQAQTGGKIRYLLNKIWLPYNIIKYYYPVLQTHKWLMPVYQVRRWFRIAFCGDLDGAVQTIKANAGMDEETVCSVRQLLNQLGL